MKDYTMEVVGKGCFTCERVSEWLEPMVKGYTLSRVRFPVDNDRLLSWCQMAPQQNQYKDVLLFPKELHGKLDRVYAKGWIIRVRGLIRKHTGYYVEEVDFVQRNR